MRTILLSTIGIAIGMAIPAGDLMAFPYIHGTAGNGNLPALMTLFHDKLSAFPEIMGWEGNSGLLNMSWAQAILAPYMPLDPTSMVSTATIGAATPAAPVPGGLSLDDL